jgi:hypothetical protein
MPDSSKEPSRNPDRDAARARRRAQRMPRFARRFVDAHAGYNGDRAWLSLRDIAKGCVDHYPTRFVDQFAAYKMLLDDLAAGRFKRGDGRSSVLLVHAADVLRVGIDYFDEVRTIAGVDLENDYLAYCWIPCDVFGRWIKQSALEKLLIWFQVVEPEKATDASGTRRRFAACAPETTRPGGVVTSWPGGVVTSPTCSRSSGIEASLAGEEKEIVAPNLREVIRKHLQNGNAPGSTIRWKSFCDKVRDDCDGWADKKERRSKRGYSDKSIQRAVRLIKGDMTGMSYLSHRMS